MTNPSEYYAEKAAFAAALRQRIRDCKDHIERFRLERLLELAEYTGD